MSGQSLARILTIAVATTFCFGPASAQLVKRKSKAAAPVESVSVQFAKLTSEALEQNIAPNQLFDGLPAGVVGLIEARYSGTNRSRLLERYRAHGASFQERWQAYQGRVAEVDKAVRAAKALSKTGKHEAAKAKLVAVVTPISADTSSGKIDSKRDTLEIMDGEMEALNQLAVVAMDVGSPQMLADICVALFARRRVFDEQTERLMWLDKAERRGFRGLGAGLKNGASRAVTLVANTRDSAMTDGSRLSRGFFSALGDHGLSRATLFKAKSATKGQWALFELSSQRGVSIKMSESDIKIKINKQWQEPYNCRETNKVHGYDPVSRRVIYRTQCKYAKKQIKGSMAIKLLDAPPEWSKGSYAKFWIIGKVKRTGMNWKVTEGRVVDFRFLGASTFLH